MNMTGRLAILATALAGQAAWAQHGSVSPISDLAVERTGRTYVDLKWTVPHSNDPDYPLCQYLLFYDIFPISGRPGDEDAGIRLLGDPDLAAGARPGDQSVDVQGDRSGPRVGDSDKVEDESGRDGHEQGRQVDRFDSGHVVLRAAGGRAWPPGQCITG